MDCRHRALNRWLAKRRVAGAIVAIVLLVLAALPTTDKSKRSPKPRSTESSWRIELGDHADVTRLVRSGVDVTFLSPPAGPSDPGFAEVIARNRDLATLRALGFSPVAIERGEPRASQTGFPSQPKTSPTLPPGFQAGSIGGYYSLAEIESLLDHYAQLYPSIVSAKFAIGTSVEGRPIFAVKISDNPSQDEPEPRVLLDALHHAREPTSMQTLVLLLHRLATSYGADESITQLIDQREIFIVPCVNPDGYAFNEATNPGGGGLWRKNRRPLAGGCFGVDLNRNYAWQWGADDLGSSPDPCKESYRGTAALSEPESAAIDAFAQAKQFSVAVSLHAHGRQMLHPFGVALLAPSDVDVYREHGDRMAESNGYVRGAIADIVAEANGNYVDHFHASLGAEAWALEIGTSFWPPLDEMGAAAEANAIPLLHLIAYAGSELRATGLAFVELGGDGDGYPDPGETLEVRVSIGNDGRHDVASAVAVDLACADPSIHVIGGHATGGAIAAQATASIGADQLRLSIDPNVPPGARVPLAVATQFDGRTVDDTLWLVVGTPRRIGRDDCESDLGWNLGAASDSAFTGAWTRADPVGIQQGLETAQPENDATINSGSRCFVTGNSGTAPGQDDVDDGTTTLVGPVFDLGGTTSPRLRYQRFYWCSKADHALRVELSNDGGQTYVPLETVGLRPNQWTPREFVVDDVLAATDRMRLRLVADDTGNTSVVEALLDEFEIVDYGDEPHVFVMGRPRIGGTIEVQLAAKASSTMWLMVSPQPASTVVPGLIGVLGLDPSTMLWLGAAAIGSDGFSRLPFGVPSDAALAGAAVWIQGIEIGAPARASNATRVTIEAP